MLLRRKYTSALFLSLMISALTLFSGCGSSVDSCMELILEPRTYSQQEIQEVFGQIKEAFPGRFPKSRLLSLVYSEEMQSHVEEHKLPEGNIMIVSVSICGDHYETALDRADYYCVLTADENHSWSIHDWRLDRNGRGTRGK